jgi:hypothetical protein
MTTLTLVSALVVAVIVIAVIVIRLSRNSRPTRPADLGAVSARWISELRRDEPWSGS